MVTSRIAADEAASPNAVATSFGAVKTIRAKLLAGDASDVVILSRPLIDELIRSGHLVAGSGIDLGAVATGLASSAATTGASISGVDELRQRLLAATAILCPDPAVATAGQVLVDALERLAIAEAVTARLVFFASGSATLAALVERAEPGDLAVVQVTEILGDPQVTMVGLLPASLQQPTTYTAALSATAAAPDRASALIRRLTGDPAALRAAGFGLDS